MLLIEICFLLEEQKPLLSSFLNLKASLIMANLDQSLGQELMARRSFINRIESTQCENHKEHEETA